MPTHGAAGWGWGRTPLPPAQLGGPTLTAPRRRALLAAIDSDMLDAVCPGSMDDADLRPLLALLAEMGVAPAGLPPSELREFASQLKGARRAAAATSLVMSTPRPRPAEAWGSPISKDDGGQEPPAATDRPCETPAPVSPPAASATSPRTEGRVAEVAKVPGIAHWIFGASVREALARQSRPRIFASLHATAIIRRGVERAQLVCRIEAPWGVGCGVLIERNVVLTSSVLLAAPEQCSKVCVTFFAEPDAPAPPCELRVDHKAAFGCTVGRRLRFRLTEVTGPDAVIVETTPARKGDPPLTPGALVWLDCAGSHHFVVHKVQEAAVFMRTARRQPHQLSSVDCGSREGCCVVHAEGRGAGCTVFGVACDPAALTKRQYDALRAAAASPLQVTPLRGGFPANEAYCCAISHPSRVNRRGDGCDKVVCVGGLQLAGTLSAPEVKQADISVPVTRWLSEGAPVFDLSASWRFLGITTGVAPEGVAQRRSSAGLPTRSVRGASPAVRLLSADALHTDLQRRGAWDVVTGRVSQGPGCINAVPPRAPSPLMPSPPHSAPCSRPDSRLSCRTGELALAEDTPPTILGAAPLAAVDAEGVALPPFTIEVRRADGYPEPSASGSGCFVQLSVESVPEHEGAPGEVLRVEHAVAPLLRGRARFHRAVVRPSPTGRFRLRAAATIAFRRTVRYPLSRRHMYRSKPPGDGAELQTAELWAEAPNPNWDGHGTREDGVATPVCGRSAGSPPRLASPAPDEVATPKAALSQEHGADSPAAPNTVPCRLGREQAAVRIQCAQRCRVARAELRHRSELISARLDQIAAGAGAHLQQQALRGLRILHFNDVYHTTVANVPAAARFATALKKARRHKLPTLTLFSGDAFSPSINATVTKGAHMPPVLNALGVQASVVGNHDLDFGIERLEELSAMCDFPWLLSNVVDDSRGGQPLGGARRTAILSAGDVRVGLMGIVEEDWILTCGQINPEQVRYVDMADAARECSAELRAEGAHCIVALTHMRSHNDERLAMRTGIGVLDIILGGHDHAPEYRVVNSVAIVKSGSDFQQYTEVLLQLPEMRFRPQASELGSPTWIRRGGEHAACGVCCSLHGALANTADEGLAEVLRGVEEQITSGLSAVVAVAGCPFECTTAAVRTGESAVGNWVTDVARWGFSHVGCEAAVLQGGCLRANRDFPAGPLTLADLLAIVPIEDPIVVLELSGAQIVEALEGALSKYPAHEGRFPQVSGLRVEWSPSAQPGSRVRRVLIRSKDRPPGEEEAPLRRRSQDYVELRAGDLYRIATSDYLAKGKDGYTGFAQGVRIVGCEEGMILPTMLRNFLYLQRSLSSSMRTKGMMSKRASAAAVASFKKRRLSKDWERHLDSPFVGLIYPAIEGRLVSVDDEARRQ
eukprot:TRINITY_DN900_c0_g4_i1.p1 TRINITY_DN900_c0_g4~~TRINITY_DN900_c0_g4_i1.p1  ORF type:complete len:1413 (+),score=400.94 TRINITY_DN900_c0_g4_i1:70-4239(+)